MSKSFICKLDKYSVIGFDMDGTLYNEFDFISQAYKEVARVISKYTKGEQKLIYKSLCEEWLQHGSSKTTLFQDIFMKYASIEISDAMINECISAFRDADIELQLSEDTIELLDYLRASGHSMFLVTDGNKYLQRKKIEALGLTKWFKKENIAISGDYGREFQKPNTYMAGKIDVLEKNIASVVYIGDRDIDKKFAQNCGFDFIMKRYTN